ncbi:hypothetical protein SRABI83_03245 [Arthrobacter sp. Bi83]|uniref:hypothetical protein n=1 Tax=Arthrobacter sp. Bi83 TaxID=2822353 RepID=UPI001E0F9DA9|nr:hypothetical protein [Arthrobacter sp. Bi83]CAH0256013.1 hypothetical protein SRABI83_03245 [Arthrobacter sp. Bi83]
MKATPLCRKCWTTHIRHGHRRANCPAEIKPRYTDRQMSWMLNQARAQRHEEDARTGQQVAA